VVATIPAPEGGASGMAWAEGSLWVGQHRKRKIHQVDPQTGAILRSLNSNRFVTGVTWVDQRLRMRERHAGMKLDPSRRLVRSRDDAPVAFLHDRTAGRPAVTAKIINFAPESS
jgi:hypothetical protein